MGKIKIKTKKTKSGVEVSLSIRKCTINDLLLAIEILDTEINNIKIESLADQLIANSKE